MIDRMDRSLEQIADEILVMDCQSGRVAAMEMLVSRWQMIHRNSIKREIKRLEIRIAALASSLDKGNDKD